MNPQDPIAGFPVWTPSATAPSLYVVVHGPEKSGKTRFALSAPGPVGMLNLDRPSCALLDYYANFKTIHHRAIVAPGETMSLKEEDAKAVWTPQWHAIKTAFLELVAAGEKGAIRTLVVDNMTRAWEACRLANLGKLTQVQPIHYARVNDEFESMLMRPWSAPGLNVVLLHREKDVYVGKDRTGAVALDGFSGTPSVAGVNVRIWRDTPVPGDDGFKLRVVNSAYTGEAGQMLRGLEIDFGRLAGLVLPDAPTETWD